MAPKSEFIDTNIILRIILADVPELRSVAVKLLEDRSRHFVISDLAISEVVYNLEKGQGYDRATIVASLKEVLNVGSNLTYNDSLVDKVFALYLARPKLSFNDCYLALEAASRQSPLLTFDHKLALQAPSAKEAK